jgi:hypothetical protein
LLKSKFNWLIIIIIIIIITTTTTTTTTTISTNERKIETGIQQEIKNDTEI